MRSLLAILWLMSAQIACADGILVLGDSLSAAYNIDIEDSWVSLLERRLAEQGYGHRVVNASASGETTGGGLTRLARALERHQPGIVIVELGGNDGLRGLPVERMESNLRRIVEMSRTAGARVLLLGIRIPPNYGPLYTEKFHAVFHDLASEYRLASVPFLLEGVALEPGLMQPDGIHPTAAAQPRILDTVWDALAPLLDGG